MNTSLYKSDHVSVNGIRLHYLDWGGHGPVLLFLAGHSLAYIELCHLAALHPERVLKLVFLDAAYDNTTPEYKAVMEKNPLRNIIPPWPDEDYHTVEDYAATLKRIYPALAAIWEVVEGDIRHTVKKTPQGQVVDKMSDAITQALNDTIASYVPEYSRIQTPVLSIYAIRDGPDQPPNNAPSLFDQAIRHLSHAPFREYNILVQQGNL